MRPVHIDVQRAIEMEEEVGVAQYGSKDQGRENYGRDLPECFEPEKIVQREVEQTAEGGNR